MMSINDLNEKRVLPSLRYAVGRSGKVSKIHLLFLQVGRAQHDTILASQTACNHQREEASPEPNLELKDIDCVKCQRILDKIRNAKK